MCVSRPGQLKIELQEAEPILIDLAAQCFKILCLLYFDIFITEIISNLLNEISIINCQNHMCTPANGLILKFNRIR